MKFILTILILHIQLFVIAATITTVKDGAWTDPSVWNLNRVPSGGDQITVSHQITNLPNFTLNWRGELTIASTGTLAGGEINATGSESVFIMEEGSEATINSFTAGNNGQSFVNGQLTTTNMSVQGKLTVAPTGSIVVSNNVTHNGGSHSFTIQGSVKVRADYSVGGQADLSIDGGTFTVYNFKNTGSADVELINGTFTIKNNFINEGNAEMDIDSDSEVVVSGNMDNKGSGSVIVDGAMSVDGNISSKGGASMQGNGSLIVGGTVNNKNGGIATNLLYTKIYSISDGNWNSTSRWSYSKNGASCNCIPGSNNRAIIPTGNNITVASAIATHSVEVETGSSLTIENGASFTSSNLNYIQGSLTVNESASYIDNGNTRYGTAAIASTTLSLIGNAFQFISPVFSNLNTNKFPTTGSSFLYAYNETASDDWITPTSTTNNDGWITPATILSAGSGYAFFDLNTSTKTLSGHFNTGSISVPITSTNAMGNSNLDGWNLVGNPYPSGLSISELIASNTSFDGNIYIWDDDLSEGKGYSSADYMQVNQAGRITGGNGSSITPNIIAPQQAFFVKATQTSGTLTFSNSMRLTTTGTFVKKTVTEDNIERLKLSIQSEENSNYNETLLAFTSHASKSLDYGLDGYKMKGNPNIALFSLQNENELGIQSLPPIEGRDSVDIGFNTKEEGNFTLSIKTNDLHNQLIFLKDKYTGKTTSLNTKENYTFQSESGSFTDRFTLIFKHQVETKKTLTNELTIHAYASGSNIVVQNGYNTPLNATLRIYTPLGEKLIDKSIFVDREHVEPINSQRGFYLHVEIISKEYGRIVRTIFFP